MSAVRTPQPAARTGSSPANGRRRDRRDRRDDRRADSPGGPRRRVRLRRSYPGRHLGALPVATLVAWQVAVGLLAAGVAVGGVLLVLGAVVFLAVVLGTAVWWNGRPLWRWLAVWTRFRRRNAQAAPGPPHDPGLAPLREWLPAFELSAVAGRRGERPAGVAHDGTGYVVVLGPRGDDLIASADPVRVPLGALANVGDAEGVRLASAQLLVRTLPAPAPTLGAYAAQLGASYAEISGRSTPAATSWWVALRLEPSRDGTSVTLDGTDVDAVSRALRTTVGWATKVLSSSGLPCRPLDESELREVLDLTLGVDAQRATGAPRERRTTESWRGWSCDGAAHVSGWLRSWPRTGIPSLSRVLAAMAGLPVQSAVASLALTWAPDRTVRTTTFVRVVADDAKLARTAFRQLTKAGARSRIGIVRLDGEQTPGLIATIPMGGGAR
ncbi:type VII secretion protein EccE [Actinopolymorpha cephalotaxi]|uniref:Type VII secretion protein EccE n=1 Tax=Actinopolymorpha cephalotaxi TaxID=504797 RepID=A0A1I2U852_9ACTN|nr:type VII secretion protein EccE [Actinopolymorpha cephalotaxi]NYH86457.1 type VII secretion protein EccE [Actinopolymorpha cephalotaxi]SFG72569.1 type VII secretion protein EccE [Actinopolymorpha cephalotaxi]